MFIENPLTAYRTRAIRRKRSLTSGFRIICLLPVRSSSSFSSSQPRERVVAPAVLQPLLSATALLKFMQRARESLSRQTSRRSSCKPRPNAPKIRDANNALNKLGILSVKYFVLDQKDTNGKTHTQASLSFNDSQRGIPSWLAAPGPMGSLEYISPNANVVAGFVVKNPVSMVDDCSACWKRFHPSCARTSKNCKRSTASICVTTSPRLWVVSLPSRLMVQFCRRRRGSWCLKLTTRRICSRRSNVW